MFPFGIFGATIVTRTNLRGKLSFWLDRQLKGRSRKDIIIITISVS